MPKQLPAPKLSPHGVLARRAPCLRRTLRPWVETGAEPLGWRQFVDRRAGKGRIESLIFRYVMQEEDADAVCREFEITLAHLVAVLEDAAAICRRPAARARAS